MKEIKWIEGNYKLGDRWIPSYEHPESFPFYEPYSTLGWTPRECRQRGEYAGNVPKELWRHWWLPTNIMFKSLDGSERIELRPDEGDYVPAITLLWVKNNNDLLRRCMKGMFRR